MVQIMTHSCAVQPIARVDLVCRIANEGELEGEVDCPTLEIELIEEEIQATLEECVVVGELIEEELVVELEEDEG